MLHLRHLYSTCRRIIPIVAKGKYILTHFLPTTYIYTRQDARLIIEIVKIRPRGDIYKRKKMAKPTTIRIPEDLLNEIDRFVRESKLDRSAYLRKVLRKGFSLDKQDRLLLKYVRKELSQMEVCKELKWDPWEFLAQLKARNLYLNVELEDWLDAAELP